MLYSKQKFTRNDEWQWSMIKGCTTKSRYLFQSCRDFRNNVHGMQEEVLVCRLEFLWNFLIFTNTAGILARNRMDIFSLDFPLLLYMRQSLKGKPVESWKNFSRRLTLQEVLRLYLSRYKSSDSCRSCISSTFASP